MSARPLYSHVAHLGNDLVPRVVARRDAGERAVVGGHEQAVGVGVHAAQAHPREHGLDALGVVLHQRLQEALVAGALGAGEDEAQVVAVADDEVCQLWELCEEGLVQVLGPLSLWVAGPAGGDIAHHLGQALRRLGHERIEELLLAGVVAVEGTLGKAGVRHDPVERRALEAMLHEVPPGACQYGLLCRRGVCHVSPFHIPMVYTTGMLAQASEQAHLSANVDVFNRPGARGTGKRFSTFAIDLEQERLFRVGESLAICNS